MSEAIAISPTDSLRCRLRCHESRFANEKCRHCIVRCDQRLLSLDVNIKRQPNYIRNIIRKENKCRYSGVHRSGSDDHHCQTVTALAGMVWMAAMPLMASDWQRRQWRQWTMPSIACHISAKHNTHNSNIRRYLTADENKAKIGRKAMERGRHMHGMQWSRHLTALPGNAIRGHKRCEKWDVPQSVLNASARLRCSSANKHCLKLLTLDGHCTPRKCAARLRCADILIVIADTKRSHCSAVRTNY